jgi:hypothetical protein
MENSLCKMVWTYYKTDYTMNEDKVLYILCFSTTWMLMVSYTIQSFYHCSLVQHAIEYTSLLEMEHKRIMSTSTGDHTVVIHTLPNYCNN